MFSKSANAKANKVLRIGIVQDGKVVHERLIKARQSVTIGESPRNTFVFPSKLLPKKFTLFKAKGDGYQLNITKDMQGKVARSDKIVDLDQVRAGEGSTQKGDTWTMALASGTRGRVVLDNLTVLFQFVPAPPESVRMANRQDFRPKLLDEDDPVFVGTMSMFLALATVLMIYVKNTDPPKDTGKVDELPEYFAEILLDKDEPEVEEDDQILDDDGEAEPEDDDGEPKDEKPKDDKDDKDPEPKSEEEKENKAAFDRAKDKEKVLAADPAMMALLGTTGETSSDMDGIEDAFADDDGKIARLEEALDGAGGVEVLGSGPASHKKGRKGGREDATIGDLKRKKGGSAKVDEGEEKEIKAKAKLSSISGAGDNADGVKSVVKRKKSQVQFCFEQAVTARGSMKGRLELKVTIAGGRVTAVKVSQNSTGDKGIEKCVIGKARRWRFPVTVGAPKPITITVPFALSAG